MNFFTTLKITATAGALALCASFASAATVTQLIHFDDTNNGAKDYTTADGNFFFDPTNFQSSVLCADTTSGGGNGSCLIEGTQGVLPMMTRLTGDGVFSLDSFYFLLTGNGTGASNAITATAFNGAVQTATATFHLGALFPNVTNYSDGAAAGPLAKNTGYIADLTSIAGFKDITKIQFSAATSAQIRLDCIVASFDGTTSEPASGFKHPCGVDEDPPGGVIPVPAGLPLLLSAMGVFGIVRARKRKAA
ncbi:VPLPA-CTERM sorting domain-containing protein [Roseovarius sp. CAU 1744]|uniref:VPLPA-CTERM sorting domain-containing protein n=1 Tax=Roseovarius sp. CAU 1744 TaxID=3140368 RepID=UPI00325A70E1